MNRTTQAQRRNAQMDKVWNRAIKYRELENIAQAIANETCTKINRATAGVVSAMPYREQYTLERIIAILQERV